MSNPYCAALHLPVPSLEAVKGRREAGTFAMLVVALLERGRPMTLAEVAARFEAAGVMDAAHALRSLQRCRPARAPVYRSGEHYELDVHDDELDLLLFMLGLRGPHVPHLRVVPPPAAPRPGPEVALTPAELQEALRDGARGFSDQRLALAVLDAHGGTLSAVAVEREVHRLAGRDRFGVDAAKGWRSGAIRVDADGTWTINRDRPEHQSARNAVRDRIEGNRRQLEQRGGVPAAVLTRTAEERSARRAAELAALRRVLIVAFPPEAPKAATLVDVGTRELTTYFGQQIARLPEALSRYDFVGSVGVHALLRVLDLDPRGRRVGELGPPQQTYQLNRRGRVLKVTMELLAKGSCGIAKPFRSPADLRRHLHQGQEARVKRALEADARSLHALYSYGRLHGAYRLRWGFVDDMLHVPWVLRDEPRLFTILRKCYERGEDVEVVAGRAPAWDDPWARAIRCRVVRGRHEWEHFLADDDGREVEQRDIQRIRVAGSATEL